MHVHDTVRSYAWTCASLVICDLETPALDHAAGFSATWPIYRCAWWNSQRTKGTEILQLDLAKSSRFKSTPRQQDETKKEDERPD